VPVQCHVPDNPAITLRNPNSERIR